MILIARSLYLIALVAWLCLMTLLYAAGGGHPWSPEVLALYCGPLAYFGISFLTTLHFIRGRTMLVLGVFAHLLALPYVLFYLWHGAGLYLAIPSLSLALLWHATYRAKRSVALA